MLRINSTDFNKNILLELNHTDIFNIAYNTRTNINFMKEKIMFY